MGVAVMTSWCGVDSTPRPFSISSRVARRPPEGRKLPSTISEGSTGMRAARSARLVRKTPHAIDEFSFRLLGTLERLIDGYDEVASKVDKPILVLYPGHDLLTTSEDVEEWFAGLETKDKEKRLFPKSYHMLLHDDERAEVLETVRKWIDRH